ncbi:MAG: site-specific DNA-methyltransferase [Bacteroidetes bacterium]|nr:site-specific DNA-methyltransferase [Bacteroidota bacterium]
MTKNFNEKLIELLKTGSRFVDDEGELVKAAVIDRAWKIDRDLVKLLLGDPDIKGKFFDEIEKHWIFNINTFIEYISDKNFLANSYTRFRNKIGLNIGGKFLRERGEVSLIWPYKDCVLEGGQTKEEEKRKEIFFNEILAQDEIDRLFDPKVLTNWKRYTVDGEQKVTEIKRDENGTIKESLIIKGNNLVALHTLKKQFSGKTKLIYIDPPYNTGNDSFGYNDSFNHSSWLTFMKNRLEVANELLRDDGVIFISCDDSEEPYLKVLCDEVFYRQNFINIITYERSGSAGIGQGGFFIDTTEFILVYSKNKELTIFNEVLKTSLIDYEVMKRYNKKLIKQGEKKLVKEFKSKSNREPVKIYKHINYEIKSISLRDFENRENEIRRLYFDNFDLIFRTTNPQAENTFQQELIENMDEGLYSVTYTPSRGKYKGKLTAFFYNNNEIFAWLKDSAEKEDNKVVKKNKLSTVWVHAEIPKADLANEGGVKLKRGKKPEQLLKRIIDLSTKEKDIVLDFYIGSGTTAAVAHKMGRQYLGVEQLDYGINDIVVRLKNVIGKHKNSFFEEYTDYDKSGITKSVNWQGGGDFIYCELMKYNEAYMDKIQAAKTFGELIELWKDIAENSFLNWYVNPEMPEEAVNDFIEIGKAENGLEKQKKLLAELLNKNQLYVNLSEINDEDFKVSDEDKELNRLFYGETYNG